MDKFLSNITVNESAIKNLPTEKMLGLGGFTRKSYQAFKREIIIIQTPPESRKRG